MINKYFTRRKFLDYSKLSLIFFLNSCRNTQKNIKVVLQKSFFPDSFKNIIPKSWIKVNIIYKNFKLDRFKQNYKNSNFLIINDGWINAINFDDYKNLNYDLFNKLDDRSKSFINLFDIDKRNKLFPVGVVPYALVIKNNQNMGISANESWDFLLSKSLKGKIIFPNSARILISISEKLNHENSLYKLLNQDNIYDDKHALDLLINSDKTIALVPFTACNDFLKIDSRLSLLFPQEGVPLIWSFLLSKSSFNERTLYEWVQLFEDPLTVDTLKNEGWYLPFNNRYIQGTYSNNKNNNINPSYKCWENSWSMPPLSNKEKIELKNLWIRSSSP